MEPEERDEVFAKDNVKAQLAGRRGPMPAALGLPCDLCITEERFKIKADKARMAFLALPKYKELVGSREAAIAHAKTSFGREVKLLEANTKEGQEWKRNERKRSEADRKHPRCKACGLAAGGMHLAQLNKKGICLECERDIKVSPDYANLVAQNRKVGGELRLNTSRALKRLDTGPK